jgi:cell division protein FtsB
MHPPGPNGWQYFWTATLVVSLVLFIGLSFWALGGGFADLRRMFRQLAAQERASTGKR